VALREGTRMASRQRGAAVIAAPAEGEDQHACDPQQQEQQEQGEGGGGCRDAEGFPVLPPPPFRGSYPVQEELPRRKIANGRQIQADVLWDLAAHLLVRRGEGVGGYVAISVSRAAIGAVCS
jgi:hypothetical protein